MTKPCLGAWRASSEARDRAWRRVERAWGASAGLARPPPQSRAGGASIPTTPSPVSSIRRRRGSLVAGLAIAASILAFVTLARGPELALRLRADYVTSAAETRMVTLPDGSTVFLGPRSAIALHYAASGRAVTLLDGEAFFKVRHDDAHGFAVTAGRTLIRDIGTAFDVRVAGERVSVAVSEGVVGVTRPGRDGTTRLTPGQQLTFDPGTGQEVNTQVDPQAVGAWTSGHLILDGMTLAEAVQTLGRYYQGTVFTHGLEGDTTPMGGIYDVHKPREALQAVAALHGGRVISLPVGFMLILSSQKTK